MAPVGPVAMRWMHRGVRAAESDDAALAQIGDRSGVVTEAGKDSVGMFALFRRGRAQLPRRAAEINGLADKLLVTMLGSIQGASDAEMAHLRIGEDLVDSVDGSARDAGRVQKLNPCGGSAGAGDF